MYYVEKSESELLFSITVAAFTIQSLAFGGTGTSLGEPSSLSKQAWFLPEQATRWSSFLRNLENFSERYEGGWQMYK